MHEQYKRKTYTGRIAYFSPRPNSLLASMRWRPKSTAPQDANDIRKEIIWGNKFIQTKGKTLYYKHWKESNINFIEDLLNAEGKFKSGDLFIYLCLLVCSFRFVSCSCELDSLSGFGGK